ncbi:MAG: LptF/LptG family permease [Elusimicrobiota bacterium]|jgi:lipopolysaccharide export system permease protein
MNTLLGRYAIRRFTAPFFYGLGVFALVVFLADLFDKMNRVLGTKASLWTVVEYLVLSVPYWTIRVVPMATLLAVIFAVSGFVRSGEFIGLQASGIRPRDFFRPLLAAAGVVALGAFLLQETLLPVCYRRAQTLWRGQIHPEWEWSKYQNAALVAGSDRYVTVTEFNAKEGTMARPVLDRRGPDGGVRQLDAKSAVWAPSGRWIFREGVERTLAPDGSIAEEKPFEELASDFTVSPKELVPQSRDPEEMGTLELRRQLARARRLGESLTPLRTALQGKLAYPFTNLILCALGIPIALRLGRFSRPVSVGAALGMSFLYLWMLETSRSLGNAGRLPPMAAAWTPHLFFTAVAVSLNRWLDV